MAFANVLAQGGHAPEEICTQATLTLKKGTSGFKITGMRLDTEGRVPGIDEAAFREAAEKAKLTCPVSVLLKPGLEDMTVEAKLSR